MKKDKKFLRKLEPTARGYVLAEGEVTGHAHTVQASRTVEMFSDEQNGGLKCLIAKAPFQITHEEHAPVDVDVCGGKETFWIKSVKEYDHFSEEARAVRD